LGEEMVGVDLERKIVRFASGKESRYDVLINTTPLDQFVFSMTPRHGHLVEAASLLRHNGVYSVGIGIRKQCPSDKSWIYFPEDNCCFYRVTYYSNYSPNNVPKEGEHYSLMCETSYSDHSPRDRDKIIEETIAGLVATGMITSADTDLIETTHVVQAEYAYPIPTLERDRALRVIQPFLQQHDVFSCGRFGAWKYELGNMDHSIMQGVETVNRILGLELP
jgi:protoporphyrinogen oxidase